MPKQLTSIQALRGLAALMVALAHIVEESVHFLGVGTFVYTQPLTRGVDLFFVISGFIIFYAARSRFGKPSEALAFVKSRFIRVAPLYYLYTTLMVLVVFLTPGYLKDTRFDIWQILTSYLFIPYERYDGRIAPVLSLGWTLNYEIFFYVVFSGLLIFNRSRALGALICVFVLIVMLGQFTIIKEFVPLRFWTNSIILEFLMGVGVGYRYTTRKVPSTHSTLGTLSTVAAFAFAALYFLNLKISTEFLELPRFVLAGIPATTLLWALVAMEAQSTKLAMPNLLCKLGDSSYTLYLSHRFILRPIQLLTKYVTPILDGIIYLFVPIAFTCCLLAAHFLYLRVELPLLRFLRNLTLPSDSKVAS